MTHHDPNRPRVPEIRALVAAYYDKHCTGGNCHVVLDDGNIDDRSVQCSLDRCEANGDSEGAAIMRAFLRMSKTQRNKASMLDSR